MTEPPFSGDAFWSGAFWVSNAVTSTRSLQLPVNAVLADQQDLEVRASLVDVRPPNVRRRSVPMFKSKRDR
jgi:hypothetical protein